MEKAQLSELEVRDKRGGIFSHAPSLDPPMELVLLRFLMEFKDPELNWEFTVDET